MTRHRDSQLAFRQAILDGFLNGIDQESPTYAGKWMYMHTEKTSNGEQDAFKNIMTRRYIFRTLRQCESRISEREE